MTPQEIAELLANGHATIVQQVSNMDPNDAHQLLLRLVKENDPPGIWQHLLARGYVSAQKKVDN